MSTKQFIPSPGSLLTIDSTVPAPNITQKKMNTAMFHLLMLVWSLPALFDVAVASNVRQTTEMNEPEKVPNFFTAQDGNISCTTHIPNRSAPG
mmetsp:Transcript_127603/g.248676  ORF Transcript_127603/g.248676 Transcript_127603/m.248676 type:complete len:93 (-) Transcript_127603:683-961(-)